MLIAEARVETERSSRYLAQLCRHVQKVSQRNPDMQAHVEWSDDRGVISFRWGGRCTLRADPGTLTLRAEAPDEQSLRRVEDRVADRLEGFGRRDGLTVTWAPTHGAGEQVPRRPPSPTHEGSHMADPPHYPDTGEDAGAGSDRGPTTDKQSWAAKAFLISIGLLVALLIVLHILGGGFRGLH
jgi:hypothetical protein